MSKLEFYSGLIQRGGGVIPAGNGLLVVVAPGPTPPAGLKGCYVPLENATPELILEAVTGLKSRTAFPDKALA